MLQCGDLLLRGVHLLPLHQRRVLLLGEQPLDFNDLVLQLRPVRSQLLLGLLLHDHPTLRVLQLVVGAGLGHRPTDDDLLSVQL